MINAEVFKQIFGIYATELWVMSESDFLEWLNAKYVATDQRPKGEWQEAPYIENACVPYYWYLRCSECGYKVYDDVNYNYCPICGAEMEMKGDKE